MRCHAHCTALHLHCYWQVRSLNQWLNHALENDSDIAKTIKALTTECASALIPLRVAPIPLTADPIPLRVAPIPLRADPSHGRSHVRPYHLGLIPLTDEHRLATKCTHAL